MGDASNQPTATAKSVNIISRAFFDFLKSVDNTPRDESFLKRAGGVFFANEARGHSRFV